MNGILTHSFLLLPSRANAAVAFGFFNDFAWSISTYFAFKRFQSEGSTAGMTYSDL